MWNADRGVFKNFGRAITQEKTTVCSRIRRWTCNLSFAGRVRALAIIPETWRELASVGKVPIRLNGS
ncbi:hypothetical protein GCM10023208_02720 [Erythrobacter westpacificensis]|uniref:Transposase n=1 Tax=Erythrobacter westpacificensis TaxID=1055231 RepID=A0ABP9JXD9_9SPHN